MSIDYYNNNTQNFIDRTMNIDMSTVADRFLDLIVDKGCILDVGCGSGRDSLYFLSRGYEVYAMDGSEALVTEAKKLLGDRVTLATFEGYTTNRLYDGIWACASLLHVPEEAMVGIVRKYRGLLKPGGVFYMSFKKYEENFTSEDRTFTCYEVEGLKAMVEEVGGLEIVQLIETPSAKLGREDERWVSAFCRYVGI